MKTPDRTGHVDTHHAVSSVTWGVDAVADARGSESESMKSRIKAGISRIRKHVRLVGEMSR